jgi:hypothetical protein
MLSRLEVAYDIDLHRDVPETVLARRDRKWA